MTCTSIAFCLILRYCLKRNNDQMDRKEQEDLETVSRLDKDSTGAPAVQKQIRYVL